MQQAILHATASIVSAYVSSDKQQRVTDVGELITLVGTAFRPAPVPVEPVVINMRGRYVRTDAQRKHLSDLAKAKGLGKTKAKPVIDIPLSA